MQSTVDTPLMLDLGKITLPGDITTLIISKCSKFCLTQLAQVNQCLRKSVHDLVIKHVKPCTKSFDRSFIVPNSRVVWFLAAIDAGNLPVVSAHLAAYPDDAHIRSITRDADDLHVWKYDHLDHSTRRSMSCSRPYVPLELANPGDMDMIRVLVAHGAHIVRTTCDMIVQTNDAGLFAKIPADMIHTPMINALKKHMEDGNFEFLNEVYAKEHKHFWRSNHTEQWAIFSRTMAASGRHDVVAWMFEHGWKDATEIFRGYMDRCDTEHVMEMLGMQQYVHLAFSVFGTHPNSQFWSSLL